jgi:hypothetical protein
MVIVSAVAAFVDTLCFLHYPWLANLDWCDLLGAETVEIVLAPVVIAELDKKKNDGSQKVRQRARDALQRIKETLDRTTLRGDLRLGVTLRSIAQEPSIEFAEHGLSAGHADDRLIATIIEYTRGNPGATVVLVTDDTGLTLKSLSRALVVKEMPENQRLKDEPDAQAVETQRLRTALAEYENRLPRLRVAFGPRQDHRRLTLLPVVGGSPEQIAVRISDLKKKHQPYRKAPHPPSGIGGFLHEVPDEEIRRYNDALPKFFSEMEKFFTASVETDNRFRRTLQLDLWIENYGTAPACAVLVFLHFPDGMVVSDDKHRPSEPIPPEPPAPPRSGMGWIMRPSPLTGLTALLHRSDFTMPHIPVRENVSAPTIKRTNSYKVRFEIEKAPHNLLVPLDPLFITFDSWASARPFSIEWQIYTDSLPRPTEGRCHVIAEHEKPNE